MSIIFKVNILKNNEIHAIHIFDAKYKAEIFKKDTSSPEIKEIFNG